MTSHNLKRDRHRRRRPCPICDGYDGSPRGKTVRCYGFTSGDFAHCTRVELAGGLTLNPRSNTYAHRLRSDCKCGSRHELRPPKARGRDNRPKDTVATYDYTDEDGNLLYQEVRLRPKGFYLRRPDGRGGWINNMDGAERVPYRLTELLAAPKDDPIFITEGPKDADRLRSLGLVATTNSEGAGKFRPELVPHFEGRHVIILGDNDDDGRGHVQEAAEKLYPVAASVKVYPFDDSDGVPEHGDVSDWIDQGHNVEDLMALVDALVPYEPDPTLHTNGARRQLAGGLVPTLAAAITTGEHFAIDVGGRLCHYRDGVYQSAGARVVQRLVKRLMREWGRESDWSSHKAEETVKYISVDAAEIPETPPIDTLNLNTTLLDVTDPSSPVLFPHSPEHLSTIRLPIHYDPHADCPEVKSFIKAVAPEDCHDLVFEILGVMMVPGLGIRWAILLVGEGGTGKSTFRRLVKTIVGPTLVSSMALHKIEDNTFATARLLGKLINICADLPDKHLETTSIFRAITGGDGINAEFKHKDSFDFHPYSRLMFSANHFPRSGDASSAFFERWMPIPFNNKFRDQEGERDQEELLSAMTTHGERSGLLNMALHGLARFRARGNRYTVPKSIKKALEEFRATTDPVAVWLERNLVLDQGALVTKDDLLTAYNAAAVKEGQLAMNNTSFGIALKRSRPDLFNPNNEKQRTINGKVTWVWLGVGLREAVRTRT